MLFGMVHLPSLFKRTVGAYVGHHNQFVLIEYACVGQFELGGKSSFGAIALDASAKGHAVGREPVGRCGVGIRASQFLHRRQTELMLPVMNAKYHEGTPPVVFYKVEHPSALRQGFEVQRKVGGSSCGRSHPCVHGQTFGRAQGIAGTVFILQVAGVQDAEIVAGGIVKRKTYGGSRVGKDHFANHQVTVAHIQTSQRFGGLHDAFGTGGGNQGKESAQKQDQELFHKSV